MNQNGHAGILLLCIIMLGVALFAAAQQRDTLKVEAVKRGFAQWVVNDSGNTKFRWKGEQQ